MKIPLLKRLIVLPIFIPIVLLRGIELLGSSVRWFIGNSPRVLLYIVVATVALKGLFLEGLPSAGLSNLPGVVTPRQESPKDLPEGPTMVVRIPEPVITAKAVLVKDVESGKTLLAHNSREKHPPASTAKLMTALVALDLYALEDTLSVPEFCTTIEGQRTGFQSEERYSVRDLIYSLLIGSSADAACTLSLGKVSYTEFVDQMNMKSAELGLEDTRFTNPVGLDASNGDHLSTTEDLYDLALHARSIPLISEAVGLTSKTVVSSEGEEFQVWNTNELLWSLPGTVGIKTGTTEAAGEVLIYEYSAAGKDIIIVVMGSEERFLDTRKILDWVLVSYSWDV